MSVPCLSGIVAQRDRDTQRQWWAEKRDPVGVPLPTSDEKYGLQPPLRCACHAPQVFFKSQAPKHRRVLQDRFQQGATPLGFPTFNSTFVLLESQEVGEMLSEAGAIFSQHQM